MSEPLKHGDPAAWMLNRGRAEEFAIAAGAEIPESERWVTQTEAFSSKCYICNDPEFALMGLPLCKPCPNCQKHGKVGHVPADDEECTDCGYNLHEHYDRMNADDEG